MHATIFKINSNLIPSPVYQLKQYVALLYYTFRSSEALMTSEDDFELMEIPLSPTNYEQPSTPDHEPPSALEAEKAITEVLDNLRSVRNTFFV